jgi:hypothetical protein
MTSKNGFNESRRSNEKGTRLSCTPFDYVACNSTDIARVCVCVSSYVTGGHTIFIDETKQIRSTTWCCCCLYRCTHIACVLSCIYFASVFCFGSSRLSAGSDLEWRQGASLRPCTHDDGPVVVYFFSDLQSAIWRQVFGITIRGNQLLGYLFKF